MDFVAGEILAFDKPYRWTSFDVVGKVRWLLCKKLGVKKLKVGHSGTLDPLATGVVVVCTGKKTKLIDELQAHQKEYVATLQLGATTPSFDLEKEIDATYPTEHITRELVEEVIPTFTGEQWQVPPMFSAVKVDGKRAYKLARQGEEVELKAKLLVIDEIEIQEMEKAVLREGLKFGDQVSELQQKKIIKQICILYYNLSIFLPQDRKIDYFCALKITDNSF